MTDRSALVALPITETLSKDYGMNPVVFITTLVNSAFAPPMVYDKAAGKKVPAPFSNEEIAAVLTICRTYQLNPLLKEIYPFRDKAGRIQPIVGVDGWIRLMNEHPRFEGLLGVRPVDEPWYEAGELDPDNVPEAHQHKRCPRGFTVSIKLKGIETPYEHTEWMDEIYRPPTYSTYNGGYWISGPWQTHTKRMGEHKTVIQGGRQQFGFSGIMDLDEAERIEPDSNVIEGELVAETPSMGKYRETPWRDIPDKSLKWLSTRGTPEDQRLAWEELERRDARKGPTTAPGPAEPADEEGEPPEESSAPPETPQGQETPEPSEPEHPNHPPPGVSTDEWLMMTAEGKATAWDLEQKGQGRKAKKQKADPDKVAATKAAAQAGAEKPVPLETHRKAIMGCPSLAVLRDVWSGLPRGLKVVLEPDMREMQNTLSAEVLDLFRSRLCETQTEEQVHELAHETLETLPRSQRGKVDTMARERIAALNDSEEEGAES